MVQFSYFPLIYCPLSLGDTTTLVGAEFASGTLLLIVKLYTTVITVGGVPTSSFPLRILLVIIGYRTRTGAELGVIVLTPTV